MSSQYVHYQPTTPPAFPLEDYVWLNHSRHQSKASFYSDESSPLSIVTGNTSPGPSPIRHHHGQALLPKTRSQDVLSEPVSAAGPRRHSRISSSSRNPPGFTPYPLSRPRTRRNVVDTSAHLSLASPISPAATISNESSFVLTSPMSIYNTRQRHSRSMSTSNIDEATLSRYGYPTYRQLPRYVPSMQVQTTPTTPVTPVTPSVVIHRPQPQALIEVPQIGPVRPPRPLAVPNPRYYLQAPTPQRSPVQISPREFPSSTNLFSYLTTPAQAINLVRNVNVVPTRGMHDFFWWDIRNLRNWSSFSLATFDSIHGLTQLLKTEIPESLAPPVAVPSSHLAPTSEPELIELIRDIYAPRVNAAVAVSQGKEHIELYAAPDIRRTGHKNHGHPHFLANYATDTDCTNNGLPRGRLVGIVKSFDRWNSGMRNEAPHRRVEYLNGLAHLQRCMREHSCRYGFIITEIELVCVRAGCDEGDNVQYFGCLEIAPAIPLKTAAAQTGNAFDIATPISSRSFSSSSDSSLNSNSHLGADSPGSDLANDSLAATSMTASLALYFLLMLSKSVPLPSQPSSHLNVGEPKDLSRQRILPETKNKWIPEPQIGERRDAKRVRGWVWPQDAYHKYEDSGDRTTKNAEIKAKKK